jgi:hypothetical protein
MKEEGYLRIGADGKITWIPKWVLDLWNWITFN